MYVLNKIVGYLVSPVGFAMTLAVAAVLARIWGKRRLAKWAVVLALANFWIWSTPLMSRWVGVPLEAEFLTEGRVPAVESFPAADLIVLHGGSMGVATNISPYAEMWTSADRVWHAARLWKEQVKRKNEKGKSAEVKILVTSAGTDLSTGPLLEDLGVPKDAIIYDFGPRNTEEEAKAVERFSRKGRECCDRNICVTPHSACFAARFARGIYTATSSPDAELISVAATNKNMSTAQNVVLHQATKSPSGCKQILRNNSDLCVKKTRVLVVTSAWHMKRTMLMYRKYAPNVEAIPAPCDFENTLGAANASGFRALLPDPAAFMYNSVAFHEWLGYFGYKWFK